MVIWSHALSLPKKKRGEKSSLGYEINFCCPSFFRSPSGKGQKKLHHVPVTLLSPLDFPENSSVVHVCRDQSPAGGERAESRGESVKMRKCHQPHKGGRQSRHLDWATIELVMTPSVQSSLILRHGVTIHRNVTWQGSRKKENHHTRGSI